MKRMTVIEYDNSPVRRQDRLLEGTRALELLHGGEYGFLALGGGGGYGVPVNYAAEDDRIYIHCAPQGEKPRRSRHALPPSMKASWPSGPLPW